MAVSEEVVGGRGKGLSSRTDRSGNWEARKKELISTLLSGISSCIFSSCFLQPPPRLLWPCVSTLGRRPPYPKPTSLRKTTSHWWRVGGHGCIGGDMLVHSFTYSLNTYLLMT